MKIIKERNLLGVLLMLVMAIGLLSGMSLTAYADTEQSETITTTNRNKTENGTHFSVSTAGYASSTGFQADEGITVTAKNGETITKVVISSGWNADVVSANYITTNKGDISVSDNGGTVTIDNINLSTFTFKHDNVPVPNGYKRPEFSQFTIYYHVHAHNFTYAAGAGNNANTIIATCSNQEGCPLENSDYQATLTIAAPAKTTYGDANSAEATITDPNGIQGDAKVQYQKKTDGSYGNATETAPTDAGDYKASITVGGATASVEYTIIREYQLWVGSTQVTSANKDDVLGEADPGATVTFTPAKDNDPATLTLSGAKIRTAYTKDEKSYSIYYGGKDALNLVLTGSNSVSTSDNNDFDYGVYSSHMDADVTISGEGSLAVNAQLYAIVSAKTLTIESGTVNAQSTKTLHDTASAIDAPSIQIQGGSVTARANSLAGLSSIGSIEISGGSVTANGNSAGIKGKDITISGGSVTCHGGTVGILAVNGQNLGTLTIRDGCQVVASSSTEAVTGIVKNAIAGTGWSNPAGTEGEADIPVNTTKGRTLSFKKVQFPAVPVTYREATVDPQTHAVSFTVATCTDYTVVDANTTAFANGGWYVVKPGTVTNGKRISVNGTANLILMDGAELKANAGINVESGKTLNIYAQSTGSGAGKLDANTGDNNSAGIGGNYEPGGIVNIHGGNITARGGQKAAGIGGGNYGGGGNVTIYGGSINATGAYYGAGIGGGYYGAGGKVTIYGGEVNASTGNSGAGIGGGYYGAGDDVIIHGGTVTAIGGYVGGAGIGGGNYGAGDDVIIHGGTVTATAGGYNAVGIGGGRSSGTPTTHGTLSIGTGMVVSAGASQNTLLPCEDYVEHRTTDASKSKAVKLMPHTHSISYQATDNILTGTCSETGCNYTENKFTLTISAENAAFDNQPHGAALTIQGVAHGLVEYGDPAIEYYAGETKLESTPVNAGTYTAKVSLGEGTGKATASVGYTIAKAATTITTAPTAGEITYGDTLADSDLTGGTASVEGTFAWKNTTIAPAVSDSETTEYDVVFTPTDGNYSTAECKVKLTVNKADPTNTVGQLSAFRGQTLADVTLPTAENGVWNWEDDTTTTLNELGMTTHFAKFTPNDTNNYNTLENVSVQIEVAEKPMAVPATVTANNRTYDGTEKPLVTVTGEATGGEMQYALGTATEATQPYTTSIPTGTNAGTYYVWYKVKGDENHKASTPVCITVTISNYIPAPTITIPVEDGSATTKTNVTVSVSGSTVNVNTITEKNLNKAAEANGTVIIDASGLKKDIKEVKLNDTTVKNIKESDAKEVEIALTDGSIVLDEKAIETVEAASTSDPLVVQLDAIPVSTLNTSQQEALAGVDTPIILKVTITRGKTEIHDLNGGKVKIKAKCQVASGKAPDVYYLTSEGVLERVNLVDYDGEFVSWMTDHCSEYVVKEISAEADAVNTLIETLGDNPTVEDVRDVRKAYEALGDKKSEVDGSLVNILKAAEDNAAVSKAAEASVAALDYEDREAVKSAVSVLEETLEKGTFEEIIKAVEELEKLVEDAKAEDKELVEKAKAAVKAAVDNPTDATVKAAQDALAKITTDPQKALYGEEYQKALSDVEKAKKTVEDNKKAAEQKAAEEKAAKEKADREKVAKEKAAKELAAAKTAARTALRAAQPFGSYPAVKSAVTALNAAVARNDTAAIKTATVTLNKAVAAAKTSKKATTVKIKTSRKTYKATTLQKKAKSFKIKYTKTKGSGKATFTKVSGSKKITVSKAGKVKVKKGIKKGTYKVKVKVTVAANSKYKAKTAKKTIKVKVKK